MNCEAKWYVGEHPSESAEGRTWPCDPAEKGHWAIRVYAGDDSDGFNPSNFKLKFIHVVEPGPLIGSFRGRIEGEGLFKAGTNGTTHGSCGGSGQCSWVLNEEGKSPSIDALDTRSGC